MEKRKEYFYEKAIQGLEFHTGRFNTWMNLYAIFVGAFFIAYYNVLDKLPENHFVKLVIIGGGFIATVCWLCSLLGYYSWLKSWTNIVIYHEKQLISDNDFNQRVYSVIDKAYLVKTGFSTQKITIVFISIVTLLWLIILGFNIYEMPKDCDSCCNLYLAITIPLLVAIVIFCLICIFRKKLLSDLNNHVVLTPVNKKRQP